MLFWRRDILVPIVILASCIAAVGELAAQPKAPIPNAEAQQTARKAAGELFAERFKLVKTTAEKTALATDMMGAAGKVQAGSADQYVLLKIARDVAAGMGDAATALQAAERLLEQFDEPAAELIGDTLLTAARLWNAAAGKAVDFDPHTHVYGGTLSPDGRLGLTGGGDALVRLWNMATRVELARYAGHGGHIYAAAFSPDGRRILSGDGHGEVRLWDTKTAQNLHCYRGHQGHPISRLAFSPDGRYGLSSADDDAVRLLGLPP